MPILYPKYPLSHYNRNHIPNHHPIIQHNWHNCNPILPLSRSISIFITPHGGNLFILLKTNVIIPSNVKDLYQFHTYSHFWHYSPNLQPIITYICHYGNNYNNYISHNPLDFSHFYSIIPIGHAIQWVIVGFNPCISGNCMVQSKRVV